LTADSTAPNGIAWKAAPASGIPATLLDAKGDLIVATAADTAARLAVGTNGNYLVADSSEATGLKWAAGPSSGVTYISGSTFSGVSSVSTDNCFTSTYDNYIIIFRITAASSDATITMKMRASGTDTSSAYYGAVKKVTAGNSASDQLSDNAAAWNVGFADTTNPDGLRWNMTIHTPQLAQNTMFSGTTMSRETTGSVTFGAGAGVLLNTTQYDGFTILASAGNIGGDVRVYGFAKG
jgi:hypothetical protein